jgi:hypothetical protein
MELKKMKMKEIKAILVAKRKAYWADIAPFEDEVRRREHKRIDKEICSHEERRRMFEASLYAQ